MKRPIFSRLSLGAILSLCLSFSTRAQLSPTASYPYTIEQVPRTAQTSVSNASSYTDVAATVSYLDGLGRPRQTVQVLGDGTGGVDVVTAFTQYDAFGRPQQQYRPVPGLYLGGPGGAYQYDPYTAGVNVYADANPYAETYYEASPLNRPVKQFGAGKAWRVGDNATKISYGVAPASTVVRFKVDLSQHKLYAHPASGAGSVEYYAATDIAMRTITDEQYNVSVEYTDLQGRLIRRDVRLTSPTNQTLTTCYVYDNYERLGAVIPPKLYTYLQAQGMTADFNFYTDAGFTTPNPIFTDNGYAYAYDARGRLIRKHIPSAGWTNLVYDRQDRLVLSQDEQDRPAGNPAGLTYWRYTRYDGLGRVVSSGRTVLSRSQTDLQADFNGVTGDAFPSTVNPAATDELLQHHYDTYTGSPLAYSIPNSLDAPYPNKTSPAATGLLTYSVRRNLNNLTATYASAQWYDDKGRVVQLQRQNHLGGTDRTDNHYRFGGELLQTVLRHQPGSGATISKVTTNYTYDHWSRRRTVSHQVDNGPTTTLASYRYDGLGRLDQQQWQPGGGVVAGSAISLQSGAWTSASTWQSAAVPTATDVVTVSPTTSVSLPASGQQQAAQLRLNGRLVAPAGSQLYLTGSGVGSSGRTLQVLDYSYTVRGWLRGLNVADTLSPLLASSPNYGRGDVFYYVLDYNSFSPTFNRYDGNIGRQRWGGIRDYFYTRQYGYSYDGASRLSGTEYAGQAGEDYKVSNLTYDPNGNLLTLKRGANGGIDQLNYSYGPGNSLTAVSDASSNTLGFSDGNTAGADYTYWPDGSLKSDKNRGIAQLNYNLLKLPSQINLSNGNVLSYQYDSEGTKLVSVSTVGTSNTFRDYVGAFQYLTPSGGSRSVFEIGTDVGRYVPGSGYEYYLKDHLGSVRAVVKPNASGSPVVTQWTDYDPWGWELPALTSVSSLTTNRAKFNGKESLNELGPGLQDFGARLYDNTIGRWGVVDPLAELSRRWSPYAYAYNNPVRFIDPDGMAGRDALGNVTYNGFADVGEGGFVSGSIENPKQGQKTEDPQPKPAKLARSTKERQQQSQTNYDQMVKRGDGIHPDRTIESVFVGGAIFKPVTTIFGRLLGGILGRFSSGFTPIEKAIIQETKQIMSNEKLLQSTFESGVGTELNIAGRTIIVEPSAPLSGMTLFEEEAFVIGKEAFSSKTELTKTILHELYRLHTSAIKTSGASQAIVSQETSAAANFADRAISSFK